MPKIYVGTLNKAKLTAVKYVFRECEVIAIATESGVSAQPFSDEETIKGALNRIKGLPSGQVRIGLEAGVQKHGETLFLVNWGVMADKEDNYYYAGGARVPLPDFVASELMNSKKELAQVMDKALATKQINEKEGAIGYLTDLEVDRKDIFIHILKMLYGQYLRKNKH